MPGPPPPDPAAWRWRGEWRGQWVGSISGASAEVGWEEPGHEGCWGTLRTPRSPCSSTRHLPPAVSGVPTAPRAPASGGMGPAPQRMTVGSTSGRSSGPGTAQRLYVGPPTVSSAPGRASACGRGSSRGQVRPARSPGGACGGLDPWAQGREGEGRGGERGPVLIPVPLTPGETRRILSVQPTYDWTCFSHSLLNVSPMPVESSPPLPCPTPCHLLPNCTSCLDSKGADGGWQHCVWSSSLQQVLHWLGVGRGGVGGLPALHLLLCPASSSVSQLWFSRGTFPVQLLSLLSYQHLFLPSWPCEPPCRVCLGTATRPSGLPSWVHVPP